MPGVFAVGDVRSGSIKRCATAVGEGAMVVRFVHDRFSGNGAHAPPAAAADLPARIEGDAALLVAPETQHVRLGSQR